MSTEASMDYLIQIRRHTAAFKECLQVLEQSGLWPGESAELRELHEICARLEVSSDDYQAKIPQRVSTRAETRNRMV